MYQGFKTVQGKSEMLPLYQDKKKHVFRYAQNQKNTPFFQGVFFYKLKPISLTFEIIF